MLKINLAKAAYDAYRKIISRDYVETSDWNDLLTSERLGWYEAVSIISEAFKQSRELDYRGQSKVRRDERDPWEGQVGDARPFSGSIDALKFNDEKDYSGQCL